MKFSQAGSRDIVVDQCKADFLTHPLNAKKKAEACPTLENTHKANFCSVVV